MYFDLDGNMAAYTEGANGGLVLITNGWHRSAIGGSEYAVQAYLDGQLQTVEVGASGAQFINRDNSNNQWGNLRGDFGTNGKGNINNKDNNADNRVRTIIANLDGNNLTPVDQAYFYSQNLRMLDMVKNVVPGMNNVQASWGIPYETRGGLNNVNGYNSYAAYNLADNQLEKHSADVSRADQGYRADGSYEVRGLSNTVYYVVYRGIGNDTMTNGQNVVVRQYTGSVPSIPSDTIEDVYAVGAKAVNANNNVYYTAQMVVIEVGSEYNKLSEQVFIPEFPVVGGNVQFEEVTMIDGKGEKVTRTVDMYNSYTYDWYNTAGGTTGGHAGARLPGLYYIDPSDTNPEIYVVKKMSPEEIRNNNYLVGFVNESYSGTQGTLSSRYPQIELKVRPERNNFWVSDFDSSVAVAQRWLPKDPGALSNDPTIDLDNRYQGKHVTDTSKLYLYNGTAASLESGEDYNVFSQNRHNNAGTNVSALNERWDGQDTNPALFPLPNRNEVLVRYSGDNIVWAVSFNETEAAQRVWWNCLPWDADDVDEASVTFWGDSTPDVAGGKTITVPYNATKGENVTGLVVNGAKDGVYALVEEGSNGTVLKQPTAKATGTRYTLTFTDNFGTLQVWTLIQEAAHSDAGLTYTDANGAETGVAIAEAPGETNFYDGAKIALKAFEERFKATGNYPTGPDFEWKYGDGTLVADKSVLIDNAMTCKITVTAEDGTERFVTYTFTSPATNSLAAAVKFLEGLAANDTLSDKAGDNIAIDLYYNGDKFFNTDALAETGTDSSGKENLDTTVQDLVNALLTTNHAGYEVTSVSYQDTNGVTDAQHPKNNVLPENETRKAVVTLNVQSKAGAAESDTVTLPICVHYVDKMARAAAAKITPNTINAYLLRDTSAGVMRIYLDKTEAQGKVLANASTAGAWDLDNTTLANPWYPISKTANTAMDGDGYCTHVANIKAIEVVDAGDHNTDGAISRYRVEVEILKTAASGSNAHGGDVDTGVRKIINFNVETVLNPTTP